MALNVPKRIPDFPADTEPDNSDKFTFWDDALGVMKYIRWQSIKTLLATVFVVKTRAISVGAGLTITPADGVLDEDLLIEIDTSSLGDTPAEDTEYSLVSPKVYVLKGTDITVNIPEGTEANKYQEFTVICANTGEVQFAFDNGAQEFDPDMGFNATNKGYGGNTYRLIWDGTYWYF